VNKGKGSNARRYLQTRGFPANCKGRGAWTLNRTQVQLTNRGKDCGTPSVRLMSLYKSNKVPLKRGMTRPSRREGRKGTDIGMNSRKSVIGGTNVER